LLLIPAVVLVGLRLHAWPGPLETDECNYIVIAQRLLDGGLLYVDAWDHQPPGVFALFAGLIAVAGDSEVVIRTFAAVWVLAVMVLIYLLARQALGVGLSWTAAFLFALASCDPGMAAEGCNREIYMNTFVLAGVWVLARYAQSDSVGLSPRRILLAGFLLGLASAIKTVVAAQWLFLLAGLWFILLVVDRRPVKHALQASLYFALGPALVWLCMTVYFAGTGRLGLFVASVFAYNIGYSASPSGFWARFGAFFTAWPVFRSAIALWLGAATGLVLLTLLRRRIDLRWAVAIVALAVGSYVAVCLPAKFWNHYYLLMLGPLVLLTVGGFAAVGNRGSPQERAMGIAGLVIVIAALAATQIRHYLMVSPERIGYPRYGPRMVWARDQGVRLGSVTDPGDTVFVWGVADTGIYYYADRRCASRFTMIGGLLDEDEGSQRRRGLLLEDLARSKPRVILLARKPFPALHQFLLDHRYVSAGRDAGRMEVLCAMDRPLPAIDWTWTEE
jgi:4-amino-4-deoxy-L-arabinose transferase-like glycosyltransferase